MNNIVLKTKDLLIRPVRTGDEECAFKNFFCQAETAKYLLWKPDASVEETKGRLVRWSVDEPGYYFWLIEEIISGEPIGYLTVREVEPGIWDHLGICLGLQFKGRGFGTQALSKLLDFIKIRNGELIRYSYLEDNIASRNLALKVGFMFKEKTRRIRKYDQKEFDEFVYDMEI